MRDPVPGDVVCVPSAALRNFMFGLFIPPWDDGAGPLGGQMTTRLEGAALMFVIAKHTVFWADGKHKRDHYLVWAMSGFVEGSHLGWIPRDHVAVWEG